MLLVPLHVPYRFSVTALGNPIDIELTGFSESDAEIVKGAWSRTVMADAPSSVATVSIQPPAIESLTTRVTLAAIKASLAAEKEAHDKETAQLRTQMESQTAQFEAASQHKDLSNPFIALHPGLY